MVFTNLQDDELLMVFFLIIGRKFDRILHNSRLTSLSSRA